MYLFDVNLHLFILNGLHRDMNPSLAQKIAVFSVMEYRSPLSNCSGAAPAGLRPGLIYPSKHASEIRGCGVIRFPNTRRFGGLSCRTNNGQEERILQTRAHAECNQGHYGVRLRSLCGIVLRKTLSVDTFTRHRLPRRALSTMAAAARCLHMRKTCSDRTFGGYMGSSGGRTVRLVSKTSLLPVWK